MTFYLTDRITLKNIYQENTVISGRPHTVLPEAPKEVVDALTQDFDVLPTTELKLYNYRHKIYDSLKNNEYLSHQWREFKNKYCTRVARPFDFIDVRNDHYHNQKCVYNPSLSIRLKRDYRYKMKPGPVKDAKTDIPFPIPQELFVRLTGKDECKLTKTMKKNIGPTKTKRRQNK